MAKSYKKKPRSHKKRQSQNQQNQNQNQNHSNSLFGGEGAAPFVQGVVGSPSEQHAGTNGSIALNPMTGGSGLSVITPATITGGNAMPMGASLMKGGIFSPSFSSRSSRASHKGGKPKKGGNLLQQLAVPAVLLYANNTFGRRGSMKTGRKTRRFKGSRRFRK